MILGVLLMQNPTCTGYVGRSGQLHPNGVVVAQPEAFSTPVPSNSFFCLTFYYLFKGNRKHWQLGQGWYTWLMTSVHLKQIQVFDILFRSDQFHDRRPSLCRSFLQSSQTMWSLFRSQGHKVQTNKPTTKPTNHSHQTKSKTQDVQFTDNGVTELGCEFLGRTLGLGSPGFRDFKEKLKAGEVSSIFVYRL